MKHLPPVAVSGMGCISAAGRNAPETLRSLFSGPSLPTPPSRWHSKCILPHPVFEVADDGFDPAEFKTRQPLHSCRLAFVAVRQALQDAGMDRESLRERRIGVIMGTNAVGSVSHRQLPKDYMADAPEAVRRSVAANATHQIAREYDLSGPFQTIVNACSAGADAIGTGASWIRSDLCDVVIAGGAESLYRVTYEGFISLMNYDDAPCKPFDRQRNGLNLGEGAGVVILESPESLKKRGKTPRIFLMGYGLAGDAYHLTAPAPDGRGLRLAIRDALDEAGISAEGIAFIHAHGTGTPDNDKTEATVFRELFPHTPYFSIKGAIGHTLGAAGAIEAVVTAACLEAGKIPPSPGFSEPDPELETKPVSETTLVPPTLALTDNLAFGGCNAALIFGMPEAVS